MKILTQSLMLAGLLAATVASAADAPAFDVMKDMSAADFRATGLDKLSDAQIQALDTWFASHQQAVPVCNTTTPSAIASTPAVDTYPMTAHIVGDFHGWSGSTRVTLDNGNVWEQVDGATVTSGRITNPKVTIIRGALNSFYIAVDGVNDTVVVKRIKQ